MQVWNVLHAACWKYRTQKWCKKSPSEHHPTTSSGSIFATKAFIDNWKKKVLSSNISSRCPYNMVNVGPLTAEIDWWVWGTPSYFNGYRICFVTARHSSIGHQSNFAALNRGHHLYSAGWPSRWALADISSFFCNVFVLLIWHLPPKTSWCLYIVTSCNSYLCEAATLKVVSICIEFCPWAGFQYCCHTSELFRHSA